MKRSFDSLTAYIARFENAKFGEWSVGRESDGSAEHPWQLPFVLYSADIHQFMDDVLRFVGENRDLELGEYNRILAENHLEWGYESMRNADVSSMDAQGVLALIVGAIRAERFCDGALLGFFEDGCIVKWLKRLKRIQES